MMQTELSYYQKGLALAEAGRYQQAFECIQVHLRGVPDDAEAINDAGAILHCLGHSEQAAEYFHKALNLAPNSGEVLWNLAEACLAAGRPAETVELLDRMEQMEILSADLINRTARVFIDSGNKADGLEMLLRSLKIAPDQQVLRPMVELIRDKRAKIAFFCGVKGDVKFLRDIYEFARERFGVKLFEGHDLRQMYELMKWSDISWFEWCTSMAAEASKLPKVCKNVVRLHRFEAYSDWPSQVRWENIDLLITVGNSFVRDAIFRQVPDIDKRTRMAAIPNGVNLDKYRFTDRPRGRNIACIGYLNMRKNPMFLLQCMQKLHYIDRGYKLFFAGVFQEPELEQYVRHIVETMGLADAVFFDGWQEDINRWLEDKHYVVSTSVSESQGMGLFEGMACGLKPVIHNFPGANQIFPSEFLFNISEDFCRQVTSEIYEPRRYRRFVEEKYPLERQLGRINEVFRQMESEVDASRPSLT